MEHQRSEPGGLLPEQGASADRRRALRGRGLAGSYDVVARIHGGGVTGQAGALRLGVARALNAVDAEASRPSLKKAGMLTRMRASRSAEGGSEEGPQGAAVQQALTVRPWVAFRHRWSSRSSQRRAHRRAGARPLRSRGSRACRAELSATVVPSRWSAGILALRVSFSRRPSWPAWPAPGSTSYG